MAVKFVSERNIKFTLYEVLRAEELCSLEYFAEHDRESFDLMLATALRLSQELLYPCFTHMDREPPQLVDGQVKVLPVVRDIMGQAAQGGWLAATFDYEHGGMQVPLMVGQAAKYMFAAANFAASGYMGLTTGAAHLILSFGSRELQEAFVPSMLAGRWQGTMALTEPQAGSSLSDVAVKAEPTEEGYYLISGQKIFTSAGDHDGVENVVHLMLARIQGAPPGVKGISLFVVPKLRLAEGELVPNDLATAGLFHKLGYRGCPIVQLSMGEAGDCRGWLVGQPHKGLAYMFQMMNEARIGVGLQANGISSAAYYASLQYARERLQGRPIASKDPAQPQVPIIGHADVRRMLLWQRAVVEGGLCLILQAAKYSDMAHHGQGEASKRAALLLDLLTPVAKTYPSEMGVVATSTAMQILGGYGYTDEFTAEQYFRDARIHPIHEGTTGIQGMDLLGRKVMMHDGAAFKAFVAQVQADIAAAEAYEPLRPCAEGLSQAMELLQTITQAKAALAAKGEVEAFLADATLYLEFFGLVAVAWQWLKQGQAAQAGLESGPGEAAMAFYRGKLHTMRFFFNYKLPRIKGLAATLMSAEHLTVNMSQEIFDD